MEKLEERIVYLITTEGKEIVVTYQWDYNRDDEILESLQEALEQNTIYFEDWVNFEMKFGGNIIAELDFKKIIGINY